jgi:hypothetical protein
MRMTTLVALLLSGSLLLFGALDHAHAQTIRGAGARPCAEWSRARTGGGRDYEGEQWTLGYVSAVTVDAQRPRGQNGATDPRTVFAGIDVYCAAHPDDMLWDALKAILATQHGA